MQIGLVIWLGIASSAFCGSGDISDHCPAPFKEVFSLLPQKVGNYEKAAGVRSFSPPNLFDYMNGHAPYYLDHGIACLGVQEYRHDKLAMLLEVYRFEHRDGAQAVYADETGHSANTLDIGEGGSVQDCYLAFYFRNYFVKILSFDEWQGNRVDDGSRKDDSSNYLEALARSIESVLIQQAEVNLDSTNKFKTAAKDAHHENQRIVLIGASYAGGWALGEIAGMKVVNKGISGEQSFEMLSRFNEDVVALNPRAVIIWGFINDIHRSDRREIHRTIERAKTSFEEMVNLSRSNGIIPILATEVTVRPEDSWKETLAGWVGGLLGKESYQDYVNQQVMEVNRRLREYAHQHNLLLLDLQPIVSDEKGLRRKEFAVKDGSHISPQGYEKLTEYTQKVLERHFKRLNKPS